MSAFMKWDPQSKAMRGRAYLWLRDLKLKLENFHFQYISKRAGGLRWYKAELMAAEGTIFHQAQELKSAKAFAENLIARDDPDKPLIEAKRLLRMIEEVLVDPVLRGQDVQMYELKCWRDDYMQFKIHVLEQRPESEKDLLVSSTDGSIKVYRTRK